MVKNTNQTALNTEAADPDQIAPSLRMVKNKSVIQIALNTEAGDPDQSVTKYLRTTRTEKREG